MLAGVALSVPLGRYECVLRVWTQVQVVVLTQRVGNVAVDARTLLGVIAFAGVCGCLTRRAEELVSRALGASGSAVAWVRVCTL